jgi:pimeloyl-ACP methyl ester carboxylesterase
MHAEGPTLTATDLNQIRDRALVMVGDDDEVTLEHAIELYRGLPDAELAVIPGTSHGLLVEKPALCNTIGGRIFQAGRERSHDHGPGDGGPVGSESLWNRASAW